MESWARDPGNAGVLGSRSHFPEELKKLEPPGGINLPKSHSLSSEFHQTPPLHRTGGRACWLAAWLRRAVRQAPAEAAKAMWADEFDREVAGESKPQSKVEDL